MLNCGLRSMLWTSLVTFFSLLQLAYQFVVDVVYGAVSGEAVLLAAASQGQFVFFSMALAGAAIVDANMADVLKRHFAGTVWVVFFVFVPICVLLFGVVTYSATKAAYAAGNVATVGYGNASLVVAAIIQSFVVRFAISYSSGKDAES